MLNHGVHENQIIIFKQSHTLERYPEIDHLNLTHVEKDLTGLVPSDVFIRVF
jgi:hypothetical protein